MLEVYWGILWKTTILVNRISGILKLHKSVDISQKKSAAKRAKQISFIMFIFLPLNLIFECPTSQSQKCNFCVAINFDKIKTCYYWNRVLKKIVFYYFCDIELFWCLSDFQAQVNPCPALLDVFFLSTGAVHLGDLNLKIIISNRKIVTIVVDFHQY